MNAPVSKSLAAVLRSGREMFNARCAAARRLYPDLDTAAFAGFLRTRVDELARAVERVRPERLPDAVRVAYDAALELVAHKLAGPAARTQAVDEGWRRVLPAAALLVAEEPERVIPAVCNALPQLAATPGARPADWITAMETLAPRCQDVATFLKLGQVAAWCSGLAHIRAGALALADQLPPPLVLALLGAPPETTWPELRQRLLANPWCGPANDSQTAPVPRVARMAGSFRGFGGLFPEPPRVAAAGGHFLVRSGDGCWLLTADVFGATFHRATLPEFEAASQASALPPGLSLEDARVEWNGTRCEFPALGRFSSVAANPTTLALTSSLTHSVALVALA